MNLLALIVLSQLQAPPLVAAEPAFVPPALVAAAPAPVLASKGWLIAGPIGGGLAGGLIAFRLGDVSTTDGYFQGVGRFLLGSLAGVGAGFLAGYFARQDNLWAKIATVALCTLAGSALVFEGVKAATAPPPNPGDQYSGGWGW